MSTPSPVAPFYLGIDVGGTNIKVGVVDDLGHSLCRVSAKTDAPQGYRHGLDVMERLTQEALRAAGLTRNDLRGCGLATPGTMDIPAGRLLEPPNLPGWWDCPIRDLLAERLQLPTTLQNDANAAAYGEFWAGRARDAQSLVFWTLGTGVGCGIILDHLIVEGAHSHAAECGHIIVEMHNGRRCGTGQYGTLEAYAGAKALIARCHEALDAGEASVIREHLAKGEELNPLLIAQCAEQGDPLCDRLVMESARYMGVGTTTLMHTIDPEMVLIGGAMTFGRDETPLGRRFIAELRAEVKRRAFPIPAARTRIEYASLGGDAGYIGAAGCGRLKFGTT